MAELSGVTRVGSAGTVICYEGKDYVKVDERARKGDIVLVIGDISNYLRVHEFYGVNADEDGDEYVRDTDDDIFYFSERNYAGLVVFWGGVSTETLLAAKREELANITATIAELEAKLADEKTLKVGDYARRLATGHVVKVVFDDQSSLPFKTIPALDSDEDESDFYWWCTKSQLVKLTPAEAKAAILAQLEAQFKEVA